MNLFAFPFAGGNSISYKPFASQLPDSINLMSIDLPGHGRRMGGELLTDIEDMVDDVIDQMQPHLDSPYALFGHSMGATIAYRVACRLVGTSNSPAHLFVSGREAPGKKYERRRHLLPQTEFLEMLEEMGGCPAEVLKEKELMEYVEPIIRADFKAIETYDNTLVDLLPISLSAFAGQNDTDVAADSTLDWEKVTSRSFKHRLLPGNHFFLLEQWDKVAAAVISDLTQ